MKQEKQEKTEKAENGNHKIKAVYTIIEDEKLERAVFRRIGTGFVNRDASLNILLDALPVSGKLHIRDLEPRRDRDEESATVS